jgi:hypothetical protein
MFPMFSRPFLATKKPAVLRAGLVCPIEDLVLHLVAGAGLLLSLQQSQVESKAGLRGYFNELFSAHA